jgi:hypothetical protein
MHSNSTLLLGGGGRYISSEVNYHPHLHFAVPTPQKRKDERKDAFEPVIIKLGPNNLALRSRNEKGWLQSTMQSQLRQ